MEKRKKKSVHSFRKHLPLSKYWSDCLRWQVFYGNFHDEIFPYLVTTHQTKSFSAKAKRSDPKTNIWSHKLCIIPIHENQIRIRWCFYESKRLFPSVRCPKKDKPGSKLNTPISQTHIIQETVLTNRLILHVQSPQK